MALEKGTTRVEWSQVESVVLGSGTFALRCVALLVGRPEMDKREGIWLLVSCHLMAPRIF